MISCRETSALVSKSLDERLSWRERIAVRLHLAMCSACRAFERQMLLLRSACAELAAGRRGLDRGHEEPPR